MLESLGVIENYLKDMQIQLLVIVMNKQENFQDYQELELLHKMMRMYFVECHK